MNKPYRKLTDLTDDELREIKLMRNGGADVQTIAVWYGIEYWVAVDMVARKGYKRFNRIRVKKTTESQPTGPLPPMKEVYEKGLAVADARNRMRAILKEAELGLKQTEDAVYVL